jgi:DHA1 family multidrug resistance protein-like MFS transporter
MLCLMGFFAILSSTMSKSPVLKPFTKSLGTPTDWTGIVAAASTIPGILISLPAASLSDIYGRKRFLLLAGFVFASAPFLYLLVTAWWQLIIVRFYHGFATAIFVPVAEAAIAEAFPTKRGERISLFSSATYVGRVIAPTLGGYILLATTSPVTPPPSDFHLLYLAVGAAGIAAVIMALPFLAQKRTVESIQYEKLKLRTTLIRVFSGFGTVAANKGVLLVGFVQASQYFVYGAVEFFLVGYLTEIVNLNDFIAGIMITSIIGIAIFVRPLMGRLSDRAGRRIPIIAGCIVSGLPLFAIPFLRDSWVLLILVLIYGLGFATVLGSVHALTCDLVPTELVGTSMGFIDTLMDVGQTLGPIMCGVILAASIAHGLQYALVFLTLGAVMLATGTIFAVSKIFKPQHN